MKFKYVVKELIRLCTENCLKLLWVKPVNSKKILFISFNGQYSDCPKYMYLDLREKLGEDYTYAWVIKPEIEDSTLKNIVRIKPNSFRVLKEIATSHIVITNNYLNSYVPVREGQFVLNTWHGGSPLKRVGMVNSDVSEEERLFFKVHEKKYSAYIASSVFMAEEVIRKSFGYSGEIIRCGLPRNAVLFQEHDALVQKVRQYYKLPQNEEIGLALYAPTFRGDHRAGTFLDGEKQFDIDKCIEALEKKFNKHFYFLFRAHHTFQYSFENSNYLPATDYPDMQELMCAADVMITDYSSCMGDMCLMNKPVFLYTPDLNSYIAERGFYWDIYSLPFPVAKQPEELYQQIEDFNQEMYCVKVKEYLDRLGSYEDSNSVEIANARILKELEGGA